MFRDKILTITKLAFDVSTNTDCDVFVCYSPHCSLLSVNVYESGWEASVDYDLSWSVYYDVTPFRTEDDIKDKFDTIINYLQLKVLPQTC